MRNFELVGKEINFVELDNVMVQNGFYSVFDDGITKDIKQDKSVVYIHKATDKQLALFFEITEDNEADEVEEAFYLIVTSTQEV